jgi:hypothetical protein
MSDDTQREPEQIAISVQSGTAQDIARHDSTKANNDSFSE